jgi:iron complex outermembrane receptor protein
MLRLARVKGLSRLVMVALSLAALAASAHAATVTFEIDAQDLSGALQAFAVQSHRDIFFAPEAARGRQSKGVKGNYDDLMALKILLEGTGLDFSVTASNAILVRDPTSRNEPSRGATTPSKPETRDPVDPPVRVTQAGSAQTRNPNNANSAASSSSISSNSEQSDLNEIVVSAQKRSERLQDVPVPVSAISADVLVSNNQLRLEDFQTAIPGLRVTPTTGFGQILSIRGITTGGDGGNPTVGIAVDDVPFGSSTGIGFGLEVPDIDPSDLTRVEVLRGPQGTLYGASSMGGLIKYVTVDPSTEGYSGRVEAGTSSVHNGAEPGYNFRGSVNVPLSDTFAVRASGFTRQDPGYIDNPVTGLRGVNESHDSGGRLGALWHPLEELSLKISALYQDFKSDGTNAVESGFGDLQQGWLRGTGPNERKIQAYSAVLDGKIGALDVTALSGYNIQETRTSLDFSGFFTVPTQKLYGVSGSNLISAGKTEKFSQEVRLSAPIGEHVEWLLGGFYTRENSSYGQDVLAANSVTGAIVADGEHTTNPSTYSEHAAFADLTLHATDRISVQIGGRWSAISQTFGATAIEPLFNGGSTVASISPQTRASANPVTYLLTPSFKVSSDLMVYARMASGYRPGGANTEPCHTYGLPCQYDPDKTKDYEVGAKGELFNHMLSFDTSLYYIDWKNIQIYVNDPATSFGYGTNTGGAKSQGIELSIEARPVQGLTIATWVAWSDAVLTKAFPSGASYGVPGDRLPYNSRFSGNVSVDQKFPIGGVTGIVGGDVSYVGDRLGVFTESASTSRQDLPGYAQARLHAGMLYGSWKIDMFVNNVSDKRGILDRGPDIFPSGTLYIQPRTVGLSISKTFGGQ